MPDPDNATGSPGAKVHCIRDVAYATAGNGTLLADLYLPAAEPPFPAILWLHAGGWRFGNRRDCPDLTRYYAARGFAVASIDYRLSEEATFPAQVEDVKTAVRWLRADARRYGIDPQRIALWGTSAGGISPRSPHCPARGCSNRRIRRTQVNRARCGL